jgi:hypothetical protein
MRSVEGSKNSLFILSIGASLLYARMNAAVIASVHVAVIACRQSRTTEQNRVPQRIYPTLPGSSCRLPDTARTASRD